MFLVRRDIKEYFWGIIYLILHKMSIYQENYSITWQAYSDHLKIMMKELMMDEDFSDVTLVTGDKKQIKANTAILSACSPLFKDMLKKERNLKTIIYLKGIKFSEMESIMQFIYLGEATFHEERMDEFLDVAKSLEIKELCKAQTETTVEPEDPVPSDTVSEIVKEETYTLDFKVEQPKPKRKRELVNSVNKKFECDQCQKTYSSSQALVFHKRSVHEGVKYPCDQCDYQGTKGTLTVHIKSKHKGITYACKQCDYEAGTKNRLSVHIQTKHEGTKYTCDQCYHQYTRLDHLKIHIRSKHEDVEYTCFECGQQFTQQYSLAMHIKSKH